MSATSHAAASPANILNPSVDLVFDADVNPDFDPDFDPIMDTKCPPVR
jgi:hypothetical protein